MGVMIGVVSFSIGLIHSTNVKKCAQSIKTGIDATRVNCMSKANASKITVCVEDDVIKLKPVSGGANLEVQELGSANAIHVTYTVQGDTKEYSIASDPLTVSFTKSTGEFGTLNDAKIPDKIYVRGGSKSFTITCYKLTGKSVFE